MRKEVFNQKVLPYFTLSLFIAALGAGAGFFIPPVLFLPIVIAEFIILIATFFVRSSSGDFPSWLLFLFVFLSGVTTTPIIAWAGVIAGPGVILEALGITGVVFALLSGYVYKTGKDFRSLGTFLTFALLGVIIASLVNIFLGNPLSTVLIDGLVLLIFLGFVLYDMSKILRDYTDSQINRAVISLYLDFLNIFIRILRLLVLSRRRK